MSNPYEKYQTKRDVPGMIRAYHVDELVRAFSSPPRMLDIGCNEGHYCKQLAPYVSEAVGVEPAEEMFLRAKKNAPGNCRFVKAPFRVSMVRGERFDVILLLAVVSHLEPAALLARCLASALNPGGVIVVLTHTVWCDEDTEYKTDKLLLELARFLSVEREELIDCIHLEANDKQGREGLQRRLVVFRNDKMLRYIGRDWQFFAAGGTSRLYRCDRWVLKWFDAEQDRRGLFKQIPGILNEELAWLLRASARGIAPIPDTERSGLRTIVMRYCGEQVNRRNLPADWREQLVTMQAPLEAIGEPLGELSPPNFLVDEAGKMRMIDPVYIPGIHSEHRVKPSEFASHVQKMFNKELTIL